MTDPLEDRAAELRRAFDRSFGTEPTASGARDFEDILAVRVADEPRALRVRDIDGVHASKTIVPLPSARTELLGVAGIRGNLMLVYDLAKLLGYGSNGARPAPTPWLVLAGGSDALAFAFHEFEGFVRVRRDAVAEGYVRIDNSARSIIDVPSLVTTLKSKGT